MSETTEPVARFKLRQRVKIINTAGVCGRIVELRGPLGPKGIQVYRIRLRSKPVPAYVEVREDQLESL